jgi:hypothetical protein
MVVLGNNTKNIVFPAKQSPFDSKKDVVAGCLVMVFHHQQQKKHH